MLLVALQEANQFDPVFTDLGVFLLVPLPVESMSPEWALVGVSLVIAPAIRTLECMRTWVIFLCLEIRGVCLFVHFATPPKFSVDFGSVWSIALNALGTLDSAREGSMSPLSAVFVLEDAQVHVCPSNSSDILADIEAPVDEALSFVTTLMIPNVDPDN